MTKPHMEHRDSAPDSIRCLVLTVSDTRDESNDESGNLITGLIKENGHIVTEKAIVPDEIWAIRDTVTAAVRDMDIDAIITNGGTGISARDRTIDVIQPLLDRKIPGFGEMFRQFSQEEIGTAAIMSRATAGISGATVIICLPGSTGGCKMGMERIVLPELGHLVQQAKK